MDHFEQAIEKWATEHWRAEMIDLASAPRIGHSHVEVTDNPAEPETQTVIIKRGIKILLAPMRIDLVKKNFRDAACPCGLNVEQLLIADAVRRATSAPVVIDTLTEATVVSQDGSTAAMARIDSVARTAEVVMANRETGIGLVGQMSTETGAAGAQIRNTVDGVDMAIGTDGAGTARSAICVEGIGEATTEVSRTTRVITQTTTSARTGQTTTSVLRDEGFVPVSGFLKLPSHILSEYGKVLKLNTSHGPAIIKLMEAIVAICDPDTENMMSQCDLRNALRENGYKAGKHFNENLRSALFPEIYQSAGRGSAVGGKITGLRFKAEPSEIQEESSEAEIDEDE